MENTLRYSVDTWQVDETADLESMKSMLLLNTRYLLS